MSPSIILRILHRTPDLESQDSLVVAAVADPLLKSMPAVLQEPALPVLVVALRMERRCSLPAAATQLTSWSVSRY